MSLFRKVFFKHIYHCRMCNQFTLHREIRIDTKKTKLEQKTDDILHALWIQWTRNIKIQMQLTWMHRVFLWYKQKVWKRHEDAVYWVDIKLAQKKGFKCDQTRSNAIILYDTLQIQKAIMMETGEIICDKVYASPRLPPIFPGTEIAGGVEGSQPTQPKTKHPNVRTERLVKSEQPSISLTQEIGKGVFFVCESTNLSTGRLESGQSIGLFTQREDMDIDFKVSELPHVKLFWNAYIWHVRKTYLILYGRWITKWTKACVKRLCLLISFIIRVNTNSIAMFQHCQTMQSWTVSWLWLRRRYWSLKIHFWRNIVRFWKSYISSKKLDVRETNCRFAQFDRIRNHLFERRIEIGRYSRSRFIGSDCLCLWNTTQNHDRTGKSVVCRDTNHVQGQSRGIFHVLNNVDFVPSNVQSSHQEVWLYVFEGKEAVIKMIIKRRRPPMRNVSRTHRVAVDWIWKSIEQHPRTVRRNKDFYSKKKLLRDECWRKMAFSRVEIWWSDGSNNGEICQWPATRFVAHSTRTDSLLITMILTLTPSQFQTFHWNQDHSCTGWMIECERYLTIHQKFVDCLCLRHDKHLYSWDRNSQKIYVPSKTAGKGSRMSLSVTYLKSW